MNRQVINKLIRSEVWPMLRRQGFCSFDSRNAWRYRGPFVDVVNFQSFSAYLADGIGCTSFSFALNLGVFLGHSTLIWPTKSDPKGLPRPSESACPFRAHLKKRFAIDGFDRADIFFIDEEGRTTAAVFREAFALLEDQALPWFQAFTDLDAVSRVLVDPGAIGGVLETLGLGCATAGSWAGKTLFAIVELARKSETSLDAIDGVVGATLDFLPALGWPPDSIDGYTDTIDKLLRQVRDSVVVERSALSILSRDCELLGSNWSLGSESTPTVPYPAISAKAQLWPRLRAAGFSKFGARQARRALSDAVESVTVVPMASSEQRRGGYAAGLFRICLEVSWAALAESPLQMWLMPAQRVAGGGPTYFASAEAALAALAGDAERWFSLCRDRQMLGRLLDEPDWKIAVRLPTMRGLGSRNSALRRRLREFCLSGQQRSAR